MRETPKLISHSLSEIISEVFLFTSLILILLLQSLVLTLIQKSFLPRILSSELPFFASKIFSRHHSVFLHPMENESIFLVYTDYIVYQHK